MIVWGGYIYTNVAYTLGDGATYDPVLDAWTAVTTNGAPQGRWLHSAVWTGSEMIIWGGQNISISTTTLGDGARYKPVSNTWTAVTSVNAPLARYGQVGVWTGAEMIIWGGYGGGYLDSGSRYNPSVDSWQAMTATGAPPPHYLSQPVWTGSEMLVSSGEPVNGTFPYLGGGSIGGSPQYSQLQALPTSAASLRPSASWLRASLVQRD